MQFEVAVERLKTEFGATAHAGAAVGGGPAHRRRGRGQGAGRRRPDDVFVRADGTQLAVFPNRFVLDRFAQRNPTVRLERLIGADEPD